MTLEQLKQNYTWENLPKWLVAEIDSLTNKLWGNVKTHYSHSKNSRHSPAEQSAVNVREIANKLAILHSASRLHDDGQRLACLQQLTYVDKFFIKKRNEEHEQH